MTTNEMLKNIDSSPQARKHRQKKVDFKVIDVQNEPKKKKDPKTSENLLIDPKFASFIGLSKSDGEQYMVDRITLQQTFINFAINNKIVSDTNHNYDISKFPWLCEMIGKKEFEPR